MYKISKLLGGGESHWYLLSPSGRIVDVAHESHPDQMLRLHRMVKFFNITLAN